MARQKQFAINEYYHLYNRGTDKRKIFLDARDKQRFVKLLFLCNSAKPIHFADITETTLFELERGKTLVDIGAYCLMGNHFHLLVHEYQDRGISTFMQKLTTAYAMYFNRKHERTGTLFEGPFKSRHADQDDYLKYLFAYIHLNPIAHIEPDWQEKGIQKIHNAQAYLTGYIHSSYPDYTGTERKEGTILNRNAFPDYFSEKNSYQSFSNNWLAYKAWGEENLFSDKKNSSPIEF